jgi:hypothetical protein
MLATEVPPNFITTKDIDASAAQRPQLQPELLPDLLWRFGKPPRRDGPRRQLEAA